MKTRKITIKEQYAQLLKEATDYVKALRAVKSRTAFFYKGTEQNPEEHNNPNGMKQFNVIPVKELISHVITANQLGYETILTASDNELVLNFREKMPSLTYTLARLY